MLALAVALLAAGGLYTVFAPQPQTAHAQADPALVRQGEQLYNNACITCHGENLQGVQDRGPSLIGVGEAAVYFQVSTGRMPAAEPGAENVNKPPVFTRPQINALAAYVSSLGGGPPIPSAAQVSSAGANVGLGQQLFVADCAACHNFVGAGGALTYGKFAPPLTASTPTEIYEAMLTGPEAMPVFNDLTITPQQKRDMIAYVTQVRALPNPGGFSLGRVGPVTEGLVAFLGLLLFLVLVALWITAKHGKARETDE